MTENSAATTQVPGLPHPCAGLVEPKPDIIMSEPSVEPTTEETVELTPGKPLSRSHLPLSLVGRARCSLSCTAVGFSYCSPAATRRLTPSTAPLEQESSECALPHCALTSLSRHARAAVPSSIHRRSPKHQHHQHRPKQHHCRRDQPNTQRWRPEPNPTCTRRVKQSSRSMR